MWKFESLFGRCKKSFVLGTPHEGLQCMKNVLITDKFGHRCSKQRRLEFKTSPASKSDDTIIETPQGFFEIQSDVEGEDVGEAWICKRVNTKALDTTEMGLGMLKWEYVGVFVVDEDDETSHLRVVHRREAIGKGVVLGKLIMSYKKTWLNMPS